MTNERGIDLNQLDEPTRQAIDELKRAISSRYPATTYQLVRSPEDPDDVGDLVVDRVVTLLVEDGISLHVIPMHTSERIEAALAAGHRSGSQRTVRLWNKA